MDQLYWQFCNPRSSVWANCIGNFVIPRPVYEPTGLVVHWSYTDVWANHIGNFVIPRPMYKPTMLVVYWPYINVCTNCIGNFVIPRPVYEPTMLVVHHWYINVWANLIGGFVILGLVVVHQCMTQPYWYFCNLLFNVFAIEIGHTLVVHWCMSQGIWLQNHQYSWCEHLMFTNVSTNNTGILWQCFYQLCWHFFFAEPCVFTLYEACIFHARSSKVIAPLYQSTLMTSVYWMDSDSSLPDVGTPTTPNAHRSMKSFGISVKSLH